MEKRERIYRPCLPTRLIPGKFGVFVFGLKDLGLGNYGTKKRSKSVTRSRGLGEASHDLDDYSSIDSSIASSVPEGSSSTTDEASARVIAMQEDEITRLRKALEQKEQIYRHQLAEERAAFKRQEVQRQRQIEKDERVQSMKKAGLPNFAPEKVMASALWDVWSFGLLMAEAIVGKSPHLPTSAESDEEFLDKLSKFNDVQLSVICEEVNECGGEFAADLVARLLNPKPQQRIASMDMVLKHRYFHEKAAEISPERRRRGRMNTNVSKDTKTSRSGRRSLSIRRSQRRSLSRKKK